MNENKNVLLIAGGGTLGTATAEELLALGCRVDIICPEEKTSHHPSLTFIQAMVSEDLLGDLFAKKHYDGIVNFIHYNTLEEYIPYFELLTDNTDHLLFLSSYRVYANEQHPITEEAPLLWDTLDKEYLSKETYAVPKTLCERYMAASHRDNWTAVRPVISFSQYRLDVVMRHSHQVLEAAKKGEVLTMPAEARYLTAGLDWAGNTGKLLAHLLFKPHTFRQAYTISSAQNLTWDQVANIYTELIGARFEWVDTDTYVKLNPTNLYGLYCDRLYDRAIDNRKVLEATGLTAVDFLPIREGIILELKTLGTL